MREHDRSQFDVELIAGRGGQLDDEARLIPGARIDLVPWFEHPIAPGSDLLALFRLRSHFKERGVDLVHTHSSKAGMIGRLAARLAGVPVVVHTAHGWSFNRTQPAALRRAFVGLERAAAPLTDLLLTVSRSNRDEGLELGIGRARQYRVVRSGIDVEAHGRPAQDRAETRRALGVAPDQLLVGSVACLKPQKAPLDFVRAAAAAHARCDRLRFVIAGDGELREAASAEIRRLGLTGVVQLLGWRRDVPDLLHAMDIFLLTSLHEGLPRAVLQALAAGLPVVATAVDGTPEVIIDGQTGSLVAPGDPHAAADRLLELAADPRLRERYATAGRLALGRAFDIRNMVRDIERLYISLLEETP